MSAEFQDMALRMARVRIAEASDWADGVLDIARRYREPGPLYAEPEVRVASIAVGLGQNLTDGEVGVIMAILVERLLDLEALDRGVPK